ncbi:MAG: FAD-binding oxidoreductase, partial [Pseudobdellovibrionaceae bacterium]
VKQKLGIDFDPINRPPEFTNDLIPQSRITAFEISKLEKIFAGHSDVSISNVSVSNVSVSKDAKVRCQHTYGKSYPDLWRARRKNFVKAPDAVVFPQTHQQVEDTLKWCFENDWTAIPFGGGTNIVGGVENRDLKNRKCLVISLKKMNQLIHFDQASQTARMQAGMVGPEIEKSLNDLGYTLGHFPDSFEFSSLGGWIVTRSSGMQSDGYGKIENLVVSLKVATVNGTLETLVVPTSSAGPDLNQFVIGSEGTIGIVTEAVMRVHKVPKQKTYLGFLVKDFSHAVAVIRQCHDEHTRPTLFRVQDIHETELSFKLKTTPTGMQKWIQKFAKKLILLRGYGTPCLVIAGFEGSAEEVHFKKSFFQQKMKTVGSFALGSSVGKTWSKDKYNVPYLRDSLMDYGVIVDVAETAVTWDKIVNLYESTVEKMNQEFKKLGVLGYIGCHLSHSYGTGACLYFTYACLEKTQDLSQYYNLKTAITSHFVSQGATLSHHHAVGYEHKPWLRQEIGEAGLAALQALKKHFDEKDFLNPGKLMSDDQHEFVDVKSARKPSQAFPGSANEKNQVDIDL